MVQMLNDAGDIPDKDSEGRSFPFIDLATFGDVVYAAEDLFQECIIGEGQAGWQSTGKPLTPGQGQIFA